MRLDFPHFNGCSPHDVFFGQVGVSRWTEWSSEKKHHCCGREAQKLGAGDLPVEASGI